MKVLLKREFPTCSSKAILPGTEVEGSKNVGRPEFIMISCGILVLCESVNGERHVRERQPVRKRPEGCNEGHMAE